MAQKKALTDEELLAQFESLEGDSAKPKAAPTSKPLVTKSNKPALADDLLADLESELARPKPVSRPGTPRVNTNTNTQTPGSTPTVSTRTSEDSKTRAAPRKSTESSRSYHQGLTPTSEEERQEEALKAAADEVPQTKKEESAGDGGWGSWFGGITAAASAAAKQAEAYAKEIQKNEEAQKWTEQLRGRVGGIDLNKGFGMFTHSTLLTI